MKFVLRLKRESAYYYEGPVRDKFDISRDGLTDDIGEAFVYSAEVGLIDGEWAILADTSDFPSKTTVDWQIVPINATVR